MLTFCFLPLRSNSHIHQNALDVLISQGTSILSLDWSPCAVLHRVTRAVGCSGVALATVITAQHRRQKARWIPLLPLHCSPEWRGRQRVTGKPFIPTWRDRDQHVQVSSPGPATNLYIHQFLLSIHRRAHSNKLIILVDIYWAFATYQAWEPVFRMHFSL